MPMQENVRFLSNVGRYFQQTVPSQIEYPLIVETESLLNELYLRAFEESGESMLTELLLDAVSRAGSLAADIKNMPSGSDFFRRVKELGMTLMAISASGE
jgi:hypothetical protein